MLYWLIPYLVVYNASDTGNWKYGPEHLFKAEVNATTVLGNETWRSEVNMFISCRPINLSFIQCRVESATLDDRKISTGSEIHLVKSKSVEALKIGNFNFEVEFDKTGLCNFTFVKPEGYFRFNMIRAVISQFNIGTDLSDKKPNKKYVFDEKSVNGICETSLNIKKTKLSYQDDEPAAIEGFNFDVPSFSERIENEPIIIEKERKMDYCSVKTHYFFGDTEIDGSYFKPGLKTENNITRSKSTIYLGKNSFSSYTENEGTKEIKSGPIPSENNVVAEPSKSKISETMRLKLVAIRPATKKL